MKKRLIVSETALTAALFFLAFITGLGISRTARFDIDEAHKIAETRYYDLFFIRHDFTNADWSGDFYARMNPPAAKYITGAWLALRSHKIAGLALQREFEQLWKDPQRLSGQVPRAVLLDARAVSVFFGALTLLAVYLTGRLSGNPLAGIFGALLLACQPLFRYHASTALTDSILLFFMTAMVPVTALALKSALVPPPGQPGKKPGRPLNLRSAAWFSIAALVMAGAAGTKFNGILAAALFAAATPAVLLLSLAARRQDPPAFPAKPVALAAGSAALAWFVFVILNPYLYHAPFTKLLSVFRTYGDWMLKQAVDPGPPLWTGVQRLTAAGIYNFSLPQPDFLAGAPVLFCLFFIGLLCVAARGLDELQQRGLPVWPAVILLWPAVYGVGVVAWVPVAWDRYFLPLAPPIAFVSGWGLARIFKFLGQLQARGAFPKERKVLAGRQAAAGLAAAAVSLGIWYGVMDRSLLPPEVLLPAGAGRKELVRRYELAERKHPGDPLRMIYCADMKRLAADYAGAAPWYTEAIARFEALPQRPEERVMAAIGRLRLAESYFQTSRYKEAAAMLKTHISALREIGRTLRSGDAKVRDEFYRTADERERLSVETPVGADPGK